MKGSQESPELLEDLSEMAVIRFDTIRYDSIRFDTIRYDSIRFDTIRYDSIRFDTIRYESIRFDTIPCHVEICSHDLTCLAIRLHLHLKTIQEQDLWL